ncbi:MAG: T9SS type A sorting domain-containing protein [Bacteroidetes bacterium]|nr:T9SS type A sorting domain-containing protein [Bacteroidota bacterium]
MELKDSSEFVGTIINNGDITLNSYSKLQGRILTTAGAININNSQVDLGVTPNAALPIQLLYFTAKLDEHNTVLLKWATASEIHSDYFLIERMSEGIEFEGIAIVKAGGQSHISTNYYLNDDYTPVYETYYRLKEVDMDGAFLYSSIVNISLASNLNNLVVYPNPTNGLLSVNITQVNQTSPCYFLLYNSLGILVGDYFFTTRLNTINLNTLSNGVYSYQLIYGNGLVQNGQVVLLK